MLCKGNDPDAHHQQGYFHRGKLKLLQEDKNVILLKQVKTIDFTFYSMEAYEHILSGGGRVGLRLKF